MKFSRVKGNVWVWVLIALVLVLGAYLLLKGGGANKVSEAAQGAVEATKETASSALQTAKDTADAVGETVGETETAKEAVNDAASEAAESASAAETVAKTAEEAATAATETVENATQDAMAAAEEVSAPALENLLEKGATVYAQCAGCHGANGEGGIGPKFAGNEHLKDTGTIVEVVLKGRGAMPTFGHLSDEDLSAVLTYIRNSFGNEFGPVTPEEVKALR